MPRKFRDADMDKCGLLLVCALAGTRGRLLSRREWDVLERAK